MNARQWAHAAAYGFRLLVLRQKLPCFVGLVMTDRCNLDCFYCQTNNLGRSHFTFEQAQQTMIDAFTRGHRFLYLTGGEPCLWRDGPHSLADVVSSAHRIGFFSIFVYTNGTRPLEIERCGYVITVDGPKRVHDSIRGGTWDLIMRNVRASPNRGVYASITLTRNNAPYLEEFVREITATGLFRGISFNLLTHQPDFIREHGFSPTERAALLEELWRLKQSGYPIALSRAAYRVLRDNSWKRPITQIEVITSERIFKCCRDIDHPLVCANCGYSGCAEVAQVLALRPSAIWEGLRMMRLSEGL
jgi:MoaA/NifB/PqqE/SkfB family radical SAM enzyme